MELLAVVVVEETKQREARPSSGATVELIYRALCGWCVTPTERTWNRLWAVDKDDNISAPDFQMVHRKRSHWTYWGSRVQIEDPTEGYLATPPPPLLFLFQ